MIAFDSDVLSIILLGEPSAIGRLASIPPKDQFVPVVVCEEVLRGRLGAIRQAESGRGRSTIDQAYAFFERTLSALADFHFLSFSAAAQSQFEAWRRAKIRIGTQDLRIAATCVIHDITLATRNKRDYEKIPELRIDVW